MEKPIFRNKYTDYSKPRKNNKPSETIPGQSYTIQQLRERLAMGLPINVPNNSNFIEEGVPQVSDLSDYDALKDEYKDLMQKIAKAKDEYKKSLEEAKNKSEEA